MKVETCDSLESWQCELITRALEGRACAYAPYSKFRVGAAVQCRNGDIYGGCNVENAMYEGAHAEEVALVQAVQQHRVGKPHIEAIAIIMVAEANNQHALPCGYCRQWLREFGDDATIILGAKLNAAGEIWQVEVTTLAELMPFSFGPDNLDK